MMRSSFLQRTLALLLATIFLFALLTLGIYTVISPQIFANNKVSELLPKGRSIVTYVNKALKGELPAYLVSTLIGSTTEQWDATVWVVDYNGNTLIRTQQNQGRRVGTLPDEFKPLLQEVLTGKECTHIGKLSSYDTDATSSGAQSMSGMPTLSDLMSEGTSGSQQESEPLTGSIVVIGLPITYADMAVGAVFMAQSMTEVVAGMDSLSNAIIWSIIVLLLLMLPIACFFAYRLARPMRQMRDVALAMAGGDFTVRAESSGGGEIAELGGALNYLSGELSRSISDLTIERNRLRSILDGLSEGIIAMDTQGRITQANPAVRQLFGCRVSDEILPPEQLTDTPALWPLFDRALRNQESVVEDIRVGSTVILVSISLLEDEHGTTAGAVAILRDVTQAQRLEQTRRDYVANVSHELRTPLTAMRALIEPLRDGLIRSDEQRQQVYSTLLRETLRLSRLVNDMLELSRLQSGSCSLEKHPFDPARMLQSVYATYAQYADDIDETLNLDMPQTLPLVEGNPDRTEQVLVAILDNAMKYTPEGGTVDLIVRDCPEEGLIRVSVRDTGPGIAPEDLPHVFERFYKADKAHQGKGTGLGLAIAHEIMRLLGEELSVESEFGHGSTFTFTLHDAPEPEALPTPVP